MSERAARVRNYIASMGEPQTQVENEVLLDKGTQITSAGYTRRVRRTIEQEFMELSTVKQKKANE